MSKDANGNPANRTMPALITSADLDELYKSEPVKASEPEYRGSGFRMTDLQGSGAISPAFDM